MAAPKYNQYWKHRKKHGRNRLFKSPDELWEKSCEYFEWVDNTPWYKQVVIRVNGEHQIIQVAKQRPYTLCGLCSYLHCGKAYFRQLKNINEGYSTVIARVKDIIWVNQFEGACAGIFNPAIVARSLGLPDKQESIFNRRKFTPVKR